MIYFSSLVKDQFNKIGIERSQVQNDFHDLISGYQNDFFGFNIQDLYYEKLMHVHVRPFDKQQFEKWMSITDKTQRKSDNLMFYTTNNLSDYLIIAFISPKGHDIFKNSTFMLNMKIVAENFNENGIVL